MLFNCCLILKGMILLCMILKICTSCKKEKTLDMFGNLKASLDGKRPQCKDCIKERRVKDKSRILEYNRQRRENIIKKRLPVIISTHCKVCETCNICKPINDFNKRPEGFLGKQGSCRECQLIKRRKHTANNREYLREYSIKYRQSHDRTEYNKQYRLNNNDKIKAYYKKRQKDNHDHVLKINANYRKNNRERIRERGRVWARENKEQSYEYVKNRKKQISETKSLILLKKRMTLM